MCVCVKRVDGNGSSIPTCRVVFDSREDYDRHLPCGRCQRPHASDAPGVPEEIFDAIRNLELVLPIPGSSGVIETVAARTRLFQAVADAVDAARKGGV